MEDIKNIDFDHITYLKRTKIALSKITKGRKNTFEQSIEPIVLCLVANEKLPYDLKQWINTKRSQYLRKGKKSISEEIFTALEELIPLLGYDWKTPIAGKRISFEHWIENITTLLESGGTIKTGDRNYQWLAMQRNLYRNPDSRISFSAAQKDALDALIPLLGYDWRLYKRER